MKNLEIENAKIIFRNFKGEEGPFNAKGDRNFCVVLPENLAQALSDDGWNVKWLRPREEEDQPTPYIQVKVSYNKYPPKVIQISSRGKVNLDEETVGNLDWAELDNVDLIINPYSWTVNGKSGIKAYLKAGYFTIAEDRFASKYYDVPENIAATPLDEETPF